MADRQLFSARYGDGIADLIGRCRRHPAGSRLDIWLFAAPAARAALASQLQQYGYDAAVHSAYKPLVSHVMQQPPPRGAATAILHYPQHKAAPALRFLMEAYPLADMLQARSFEVAPDPAAAQAYRLVLSYEDGRTWDINLFAPNRIVRDHSGEDVLRPCAWLRIADASGTRIVDEALPSPYEQMFDEVMDFLRHHDWGHKQPYFGRLQIEADFPGEDVAVGIGDEVISLHEALHEDLYFSIQEFFHHRDGTPQADRTLRPGQIVPDVRNGNEWQLRVILRERDGANLEDGPLQHLDTAETALSPGQIASSFAAFGGQAFTVDSAEGRDVTCRYWPGSEPGIVLSAGQHANETSGPVGLLRALVRLRAGERGNLAAIALENPDGYELHRRLCTLHPRHMHHAARYTALGDDVEYRIDAIHERRARLHAVSRTKALLHINLHGYPAHEWTRPLTGYVPRGFAHWTLPKGFVLIVRHKAGLDDVARDFAREVSAILSTNMALVAFNRAQRQLFEAHAGPLEIDVFDDIPCIIVERDSQLVPLTLITEYPDETIHGDAFRLAHQAQLEAVLAGADVLDGGIAERIQAWQAETAAA